jgi:DinB superfamily
MKKIFLPVVMLLMLSFTTTDYSITKSERKYALAKLKDTKKHLKEATKGLSAAQLNFKANDSSWSVAECTEHIAITETALYGMFEGALKTNPDPSKRSDVKFTDDQVWNMITDRTHKVKTAEPFKPSGKFGSFEGTLKEFNDKRDAHIQYVKGTNEDLRNRYSQLPFGTIDAYQVIIFLAAHTERHIKQIEEVKANANFPKN